MATLGAEVQRPWQEQTGCSSPWRACKRRQMITLEDMTVVRWPAGDKKPKTHQLHSTADGRRLGRFLGLPVRADLLRTVPRRGDWGRHGWANGIVGRRWDRRRFHQAGS